MRQTGAAAPRSVRSRGREDDEAALRSGDTANRATPWASVRARVLAPRRRARARRRRASGLPSGFRAVRRTTDDRPAWSTRGAAVSVRHADGRHGGVSGPDDAGDGRGDVVAVVRLVLLRADPDDVDDEADPGRLGDRVTVADAPGASRPRLQVYGRHVPCDAVSEISRVRYERGSSTLRPLTSAAATDDRFVTVIVHVIRPPTLTVVGATVFVTARSRQRRRAGRRRRHRRRVRRRGWRRGCGRVRWVWAGSAGVGGSGGSGVPFRVFVNVQTTTSPLAHRAVDLRARARRRRRRRSACTRPWSRSRRGSSPAPAVSLTVPSPMPIRQGPVVVPLPPVGDDRVVDLELELARVVGGERRPCGARASRLQAGESAFAVAVLAGQRPRERVARRPRTGSGRRRLWRPGSNTSGWPRSSACRARSGSPGFRPRSSPRPCCRCDSPSTRRRRRRP